VARFPDRHGPEVHRRGACRRGHAAAQGRAVQSAADFGWDFRPGLRGGVGGEVSGLWVWMGRVGGGVAEGGFGRGRRGDIVFEVNRRTFDGVRQVVPNNAIRFMVFEQMKVPPTHKHTLIRLGVCAQSRPRAHVTGVC
jgi:hypothetical protein